MAAALMSSAVAVPYVVNAEEPTTTSADVSKELKMIDTTYSLLTSSVDNKPTGMDDYFKKNFIKNVDLVIDENGHKFAEVTFKYHAYKMNEYKDGSSTGATLKPLAISGEGDMDKYSATFRIALDDKYQGTIYATSADHGGYNFTFDLGEEAATYKFDAGEQTSYLKGWVGNADLVTITKDGVAKQYANITLQGTARGIDNFFTKKDGTAYPVLKTTMETIEKDGEKVTQIKERVIQIPLEDNKGSLYFEYRNTPYTFAFDFTKVSFDEVVSLAESAISFDYSYNLAAAQYFFPASIIAASAKKTGDSYAVKLQLNTESYETFEVYQNDKKIAAFNPASSLVEFTIKNFENLQFKGLYLSTRGNSDIVATVTEKALSSSTTLPVETVTAETPTNEAPSAEKTVVKDLNFAGITSYTPAAALNIADYLNPYFEQYKIVKDQTGKQFVRATITGKAYGFTAIQYFNAKNEKQDVTIVSSTGEKLEQVRVIEFPYEENATNTFNLFIGSDTYGSYTLTFNAKENAFNDIAKSYAKADIEALYSAGLVKGKNTAGDYAPTVKSTRAEFAAILARAFYSDSVAAELPFKDVAANAWYKSELQKLYTSGIVKGDGKNFKGNSTISREDAVVMLYRILEDHGYKATASADQLKAYKDTNKVSNYAKTAIAELNALGIYVGDGTNLNPKGSLDRQAMAKLANQVIAKVTALKAAQK